MRNDKIVKEEEYSNALPSSTAKVNNFGQFPFRVYLKNNDDSTEDSG
jgi:hypothetical protein